MPDFDDRHYLQFARISEALEDLERTVEGIDWSESPFLWIVKKPPKKKGFIFENMVRRALEMNGVPVEKPADRSHDLLVSGYRVEIKTAFVTKSAHNKPHEWNLVWNAIKSEGYDYIILLGVFPHHIMMSFMSRQKFLVMNDFRSQKYADSYGINVMYMDTGSSNRGVELSDFEGCFSRMIDFFRREYRANGYLLSDEGETIMEEFG